MSDQNKNIDQDIFNFLRRRGEIKSQVLGKDDYAITIYVISFDIKGEKYAFNNYMSKKELTYKIINMLEENETISLGEYDPNIFDENRQRAVQTVRFYLDNFFNLKNKKPINEENKNLNKQEEAAEIIKRYGHFSSPDLRYLTRPLYAYIEYENFGRLKDLGVKYRFTPISEINLNGALSRFIKERGVFNGIGGNIIRLYNDEPVTKSDISRIKRKIQNIIDEFNSKLRTNYQIDGVVGDKSSDTLRNQLNQKLTGSEFNVESTYNNIGIKIYRGVEDEYLATIPMDEIDKPQMLD